jgi:hypothetical protein
LESKLVNQNIDSLSDLIFGSKSRRSIEYSAVIAAFILSLASGYTTYQGLTEFTVPVIAFLLTFGMQGMMLASSVKIADSAAERKVNKGMLVVYLITMSTSVFFSFISLYSEIYKGQEKKNNDKLYFLSKVNEIKGHIKNDIMKASSIDLGSYENWIITINNEAKAIKNSLMGETNSLKQEITKKKKRKSLEEDKGTYVEGGDGVVKHTGSGYGPRTQKLEFEIADISVRLETAK